MRPSNAMNFSITPGVMKKFGRTPWKFQTTFQTPLENLVRFVSTILSVDERIESGIVTIHRIVFEPEKLGALADPGTLSFNLGHDCSIRANGAEEVHALLRTALSDWVDFLFVPTPRRFVIYADHDEYTTFYANSKGSLRQVALALSAAGFREISDYQRDFRL